MTLHETAEYGTVSKSIIAFNASGKAPHDNLTRYDSRGYFRYSFQCVC